MQPYIYAKHIILTNIWALTKTHLALLEYANFPQGLAPLGSVG